MDRPARDEASAASETKIKIKVTTLTNDSDLTTCVSSLSIQELKLAYQQLSGLEPKMMEFWFPVPTGTEGAKPASALFLWWAKSVEHGTKPKELIDAMASRPLVKADDAQTVGGLAALQRGGGEAG